MVLVQPIITVVGVWATTEHSVEWLAAGAAAACRSARSHASAVSSNGGSLLRCASTAVAANYGLLDKSPKPLLSLRLSCSHGRNPLFPHIESTRCACTWLCLFSHKSLSMEFDCIFLPVFRFQFHHMVEQ